MGEEVISPEHTHGLDEASMAGVPDTERMDVLIDDGGGVEDQGAGRCEDLEEAAAEGLSLLGEAEVVGVRRVERL